MGRGRGKGKKLTVVTNNNETGSGDEEVLPAYKRRGRPQKPLKDDLDEDDSEKIEEEEEEEEEEGAGDVKLNAPSKEVKSSTVENEKKRKRNLKAKENSDMVKVENCVESESKEQPTTSNGFRHNGSRRKGKPRRAAQAGVENK